MPAHTRTLLTRNAHTYIIALRATGTTPPVTTFSPAHVQNPSKTHPVPCEYPHSTRPVPIQQRRCALQHGDAHGNFIVTAMQDQEMAEKHAGQHVVTTRGQTTGRGAHFASDNATPGKHPTVPG